jgi:uncharacterized cupin superfamily protein
MKLLPSSFTNEVGHMPKIDIEVAPRRFGSPYPPPLDEPCAGLRRWKLGAAAGLTQFGVNVTRVPPGQWTSQRHWHTAEDEFVWVIEGEVVLVSDRGEEMLRAGDCAGFAAGVGDGHHIQNRSDREAVLLEIGSRRPGEDACHYPDIGVIVEPGRKVRRFSGGPE